MSKVAYSTDTIVLEKAVWDTRYGMWVEFKLKQPASAIKQANPFKKFTKRRGDRTGTRFGAIFTNMDESSAYEDEVMLKGWRDGTTGWFVSLYVNSDEAGLHPFMHYDKEHEFAAAMVELDDDNEVIDQDKRDRVEKAREGRKSPRLSRYAAQLCRQPEFVRYIGDRCGQQPTSEKHADEFSAEWMRKTLKIASRAELDSDRDVAARFHKHIREPYNKWYRGKFDG